MTTTGVDLAGLVTGYARRLHDVIGDGHQVASPLGAWLLLALCGPASTGGDRATLTEVLGCDIDRAAGIAADLLTRPHPLVAAAAAAWHQPDAVSSRWLAGLPDVVVQADRIPEQPELDEWARRNTFGLIDRFPLKVNPSVYLILATALATKISWECPFELAPGSALGPESSWAKRLAHVLRSPEHNGHSAFIAATPEAGEVAVHAAWARDGLLVASVAAAPGVAPGDVLAAAHRLACAYAVGEPAGQRSLFDLPLGEGAAWSVHEEMAADGGERCTALLPAWSARVTHNLGDPRLGFAAAAAALAVAAGDPWQAKQAAMARYSRIGFEAAAVTAMMIQTSMRMPDRGLLRTAELRFGHPFAVVAVTVDEQRGRPFGRSGHADGARRADRGGAAERDAAGRSGWHGVPVFSAWVAEPENAEDGPRD